MSADSLQNACFYCYGYIDSKQLNNYLGNELNPFYTILHKLLLW